MKTIFIFDDSRITDMWTLIVALGEDGQLVTAVKFGDTTAPYARFAMGVTHELDETLKPAVTDPLWSTREHTLQRYDETYGPGNWLPVWIDLTSDNVSCVEAIRLFQQRSRQLAEEAAAQESERLAGFLSALFALPPELRGQVH